MKDKRTFPKWPILFISVLSLFLLPTFTFGATFCVSDATGLQSALTTAQSNGEDDTIQIVQGTYEGNWTYASTEANSLAVEGGYTSACASQTIDPGNTVLDGGGVDNVLALVISAAAPDLSVEGLTLRNGSASTVAQGGGLYAKTSGRVTLTNNIFSGNTASIDGGGSYVYCTRGALTDNTFSGNTATDGYGGGAYVYGACPLTNNIFSGNTASIGGGAYVHGEDIELYGACPLTNNIFSGNTAASMGGGAYVHGTGTLTDNTFSGNTATDGYGGGAYVYYTGALTNNIYRGNAASYGGAIYANASDIAIINNTISENTATYQGGGLWVRLNDNEFTGKLYNNIIWKNTAPKVTDLYIDNTLNDPLSLPVTVNLFNNDFDQSASGIYITTPFAIDSSNLNNVDPLFVSSGNYYLSSSSPCINKGKNDAPSIPTTDKDGNPRIVNVTVDIGAYEYNPLTPTANAGPDQTAHTGLTVTLDGSNSSDPEGETLAYLWIQTGGTIVTLSNTTAVQPTFTAPAVPGGLIFQLAVTNTDGLKNTDSVGVDIGPVISTVTTTAASSVTSTSATLNGTVNPNGASTTVTFEYGTTTSYGSTITATQSPLTGTTSQSVSASITGLTPGTIYHFRAKATNSVGTSYGTDVTFTTPFSSILYVNRYDGTCGGNSPCHSTIQAAINAAPTGSAVRIAHGTYISPDSAILNDSKIVTIQGGWNYPFTSQTPRTTYINAPRANQGTLKVQEVVIQP